MSLLNVCRVFVCLFVCYIIVHCKKKGLKSIWRNEGWNPTSPIYCFLSENEQQWGHWLLSSARCLA